MTNYYEIVSCADSLDLWVKWDIGVVPEASELKSSFTLESDVDRYYVCNRFYEWNCKDILHRIKGGDRLAIHNS